MRLVSVGSQHSVQGEVGANISVEHEEGLRAPSQDLIPEVVETTSCAQRGKFLQVPVPRDPRASSVTSEESDTMNLGTDPSCSQDMPAQGPQRNSIYTGIQKPPSV